MNLIKFQSNQPWKLIYQASKDGFDSITFHSRCGTARNVLLVTRTKNSSNIFGGFTSVGWGQQSSSVFDSNAFLFSLKNNKNISVVMNVTKPENAIYSSIYNGPTFGTGYDLLIPLSYYKYDSYIPTGYSNLGYSYELPNFLSPNESYSFLAGFASFQIFDLEAYAYNQCWNSPCLNEGVCIENGENYTCYCKNGFYGNKCQTKKLDSTIFVDSTILTQNLSLTLLSTIEFTNLNFKLLYQATRDSFSASAFHSKCNGIYGTLSIVKSRNGYIFGGYTQADWSGYWNYKYDSNAFLFSLINGYNTSVKMPIIYPSYAIYASDYYGPTFGSGYSLYIADQADINRNSYSYLYGSIYQIPSFVSDANAFLAGSYSFSVDDIEVYSVHFSNTTLNDATQYTTVSYT